MTPYLEATGNTAAVNSVELVARVHGYVQEMKYQDGDPVKKGTPLFVIEPEPYKVKLEQAKAAEEGAKAALINAQAEFNRRRSSRRRDVSTQANLDKARSQRDTRRANVEQAQAKTQTAEINLAYTTSRRRSTASSRRDWSRPVRSSGAAANELATIVQLDPIYVNFNVNERTCSRSASNWRRGRDR